VNGWREAVANEMNDIVVVDDNPLLVSVLAEIFKEHGCIVRTASDGFEALATIRERVPDVLISDLNMPRMTGFELLSVVRRRFPTIAVVAMSGAYSGATIPAGVAADGFYAKGSSSVARLFEILSAVGDEAERDSARDTTPIWIPGVPIDERDLSTTAVACPECLRTFSHRLHNLEFSCAERRCPHCLHTLRLSIVRPQEDMDKTRLSFSATGKRLSELAYQL
jgi:CheY-like chemotaxis protein